MNFHKHVKSVVITTQYNFNYKPWNLMQKTFYYFKFTFLFDELDCFVVIIAQ